ARRRRCETEGREGSWRSAQIWIGNGRIRKQRGVASTHGSRRTAGFRPTCGCVEVCPGVVPGECGPVGPRIRRANENAACGQDFQQTEEASRTRRYAVHDLTPAL